MNITQISLESLSFNGYGVLLENELIQKSQLDQSVAETDQQITQAQELLRKLFSQDVSKQLGADLATTAGISDLKLKR